MSLPTKCTAMELSTAYLAVRESMLQLESPTDKEVINADNRLKCGYCVGYN